jgi:hypothetical protein
MSISILYSTIEIIIGYHSTGKATGFNPEKASLSELSHIQVVKGRATKIITSTRQKALEEVKLGPTAFKFQIEDFEGTRRVSHIYRNESNKKWQ